MPPSSSTTSLTSGLLEIIQSQRLSAVFQPIAVVNEGQVYGYEGLIRGPQGHALESPVALFAAAEAANLVAELDAACRSVIIRRFAELALPGHLFLNICPGSLTVPLPQQQALLDVLHAAGLSPSNVIIELTETQTIENYAELSTAVRRCREQGFKLALDDLGEGFSSLRLWSELKPDFVKIDKYFIQGLNSDPQKRQFVRSIQQIALNTKTSVIAEGIETVAELDCVRQIGITLIQGYLLARPAAEPLHTVQLPSAPASLRARELQTTAASLLQLTPAASPRDNHDAIWRRFQQQADLHAIPVVENDQPIGLIKRHDILELFSRPYSRELFGNRDCRLHMDPQPLVVEQSTSLTELAQLVTASERLNLDDGFIITERGRYLGMGTGRELIRAMTEMQLAAARHANPLTGLPGNAPIQDTMSHLLAQQLDFTVVYVDLDHFKPYNDVYGYARGDELLKFLGALLQQAFDPVLDFVGHVGGDDFILLLRSHDWQARCETVLAQFETMIGSYFTSEDRAAGGYNAPNRQGQMQFHPLVSLSLGAAQILAKWYESHHEVANIASSAKSMAKREQGNSIFIDRRTQRPPLPPANRGGYNVESPI
ncbi:GGDEF domain-containing protein [Chitinibacter tainanensis]|uniref:GGDEF domain-containing protein n=1 Tax=Chitinibacter tainanensis TaxID=230667 RepID=UPI0023528F93|nr:GGDEF domain-containing protein [Chitinibacter tainanensis]